MRERWVIGLASIWIFAVVGGVAVVGRYSLTAGAAAIAAPHWPADLRLLRAMNRDTLVMVVHPDCPCSRASMSELATLQANCQSALSIDVLFAEPSGLADNVGSTDLWQSASQIPGAQLIVDEDERISRRLGAKTSGQVYLYDRDGSLKFSGGITAARGHAGNNAGRSAIEDIVHHRAPDAVNTPVFGCSL